jgi:hypothetical protein
MAEYSEDNRFPFHTASKSVAICNEDHEEMYELDFIFTQVVERFPALDPRPFYKGIEKIQKMRERDRLKHLKEATDKLLKSIKSCLMDEEFVH